MRIVEDKQIKYEKALKYEIFVKEEYGFAKEKIQNARCIFDIGGHIGLFSQRCRFLNQKAKIYYFEPVGEFFDRAKINLGGDRNIVLNNYGIGTKSGSGKLLLNKEKTMQTSKYSSFLNPSGIEVLVDFITLRDYLQKNSIDKIDVLKIDIEGMEFEVLSSRSEFEWQKIENLIVEIHLLNEEMKSDWNQILLKMRNVFGSFEIINTGYREEIFLVWASKI